MATNFPTSLDSLTNPLSTDTLNSPSHADQHANVNDAVEALEAKVGVNSSAVTTSHDYKIAQLEGKQYVTLTSDSQLTSERVLTAGTGITVTDAGAGSTVTVATSAILPTIVDAKGDLIAGTADNTVARVPASTTNGQVLTVDTAQATGLTWATPSGGGGATDSDQNILAVQVFS